MGEAEIAAVPSITALLLNSPGSLSHLAADIGKIEIWFWETRTSMHWDRELSQLDIAQPA